MCDPLLDGHVVGGSCRVRTISQISLRTHLRTPLELAGKALLVSMDLTNLYTNHIPQTEGKQTVCRAYVSF